jgi:uncharacterized protein
MENMRRWLIAGLFLFFLFLPFWVLAQDFPSPVGYVNDFAGMLSGDFKEKLEKDLGDFEDETTAEIAVVTIETLGDYSIEEYSVRLFEQWQIGKKEKDNGLLLLISQEDRKMRIEVGYGLEPVVTDGRAGKIIREEMRPNFRNENYDRGVSLAIEKIKGYIRSGEPPKGEEAVQETVRNSFIFFIIGGIILIWVTAFLGRTKEFITGGIIGGLLGGFFGWIAGAFLGMTVLFGAIGLLLDYIFSRNYKKLKAAGKSTGFWSSWGGFSSKGNSHSSGGFGGFGGGSSGGGGAGGSW